MRTKKLNNGLIECYWKEFNLKFFVDNYDEVFKLAFLIKDKGLI